MHVWLENVHVSRKLASCMWWAFFHPGLMEKQSLSCLPYATSLLCRRLLWPTKQFIHNKYLLYRWRNCSWAWLTLQTCYSFALKWVKVRQPEECQLGIGFCMNTMQQAWCELTESHGGLAMTQLAPGLRTLPFSGNAGYRLMWGIRCFLYTERPANWISIIHVI